METVEVRGERYVFWSELADSLGISGRTLERAIEAVNEEGAAIISTIIQGKWAMREADAKRVKAYRQAMKRRGK